jgi:hypothetical protein
MKLKAAYFAEILVPTDYIAGSPVPGEQNKYKLCLQIYFP